MKLKRKKKIFIHTNQPLITTFYIKRVPIFCRISVVSIRNFLHNGNRELLNLKIRKGEIPLCKNFKEVTSCLLENIAS